MMTEEQELAVLRTVELLLETLKRLQAEPDTKIDYRDLIDEAEPCAALVKTEFTL